MNVDTFPKEVEEHLSKQDGVSDVDAVIALGEDRLMFEVYFSLNDNKVFYENPLTELEESGITAEQLCESILSGN